MKNKILLAIIIIQILILGGMYLNSLLPGTFGKEIKILTTPIDPRDLFRGNYVSLDYEFSSIPTDYNITSHAGDVVYALLKEGKKGIYEFERFSFDMPKEAVFLRGRVQSGYRSEIKYGLEAFFMPKKQALEFEEEARRSKAIVTIGVLSNGRAGIKDIALDKNSTK